MPYQRYRRRDLRDAFKPSQSPEPREAKYDLNPSIDSYCCLMPIAFFSPIARRNILFSDKAGHAALGGSHFEPVAAVFQNA
jgi:hypothetical protein